MHYLPQGWIICKLNEIIELFGGFAFKSKDYTDSGVPVLRMGNITKDFKLNWNKPKQPYIPIHRLSEFEKYKLEGGEIVICLTDLSETGAYLGTVAIVEGQTPALLNQRVSKIIFNETLINKKYLYFALCNPSFRHYMVSDDTGSLQKNTNHNYILEYKFQLAPLNEQKRIVAKLEKLLGKVNDCQERLEKIPTLLKRFRQSVLAAACSGRLTADWREKNPNVEPAEELLNQLETPYPKPHFNVFEQSCNYDIPNSWKFIPLGKLGTLTGGGTPAKSKAEYWEGHIPWISAKDMKFDRIRDSINHISEDAIKNSSTKKIPKGSILFVVRGMILAHTFPVAITDDVVTVNQDIKALIPEKIELNEYLFISIKLIAQNILFATKEATHGTRRVETGVLQNWAIPLPPLEEQKEIVKRVKALFKKCDLIEQRYQQAKAYTDKLTQSILAKAFRGELVPQDPNDEPASVLLEKIKAEKAEQEKKPKRKTTKKRRQK